MPAYIPFLISEVQVLSIASPPESFVLDHCKALHLHAWTTGFPFFSRKGQTVEYLLLSFTASLSHSLIYLLHFANPRPAGRMRLHLPFLLQSVLSTGKFLLGCCLSLRWFSNSPRQRPGNLCHCYTVVLTLVSNLKGYEVSSNL